MNPHAAAIDIGAQFHVVAVGPERDLEPVRSFRSFTQELHQLAQRLEQVEITTVAMESTGIQLDSRVRSTGPSSHLRQAKRAGKRCKHEIALSELFISSREAAKMLGAIKESFDRVVGAVQGTL